MCNNISYLFQMSFTARAGRYAGSLYGQTKTARLAWLANLIEGTFGISRYSVSILFFGLWGGGSYLAFLVPIGPS